MNKAEYEEKSRKLKLPCRCPLVGKCMRWAETVFQCETMDLDENPRQIINNTIGYLISEGRVTPKDSIEMLPIVTADREWPGASTSRTRYGDETWVRETVYRNACPDYTLKVGFTLPGSDEPVAIRTAWIVEDSEGRKSSAGVATAHFSECLEFIRHEWQQRSEPSGSKRKSKISPRVRFRVFKRDGFKCVYCNAKASEGATLEADHKISVKDGGTDEESNLVCACWDCNRGKGKTSISLTEYQ